MSRAENITWNHDSLCNNHPLNKNRAFIGTASTITSTNCGTGMYTICPTVHRNMRAWKITLIDAFDDLLVICSTMRMEVRSCGTSWTRKHILLKLWSGYVNDMLHRVTAKEAQPIR